LAPRLRERSGLTEELRRVPDESIAELVDSGLFGIATPRQWGGSDLGYSTWIAVTAEIAAACPSTGWVYGVLLGHYWLAACFPLQAQQEVFGNPRSLVASLFRLGGTVEKTEDGYVWRDGKGRFCSGIDHSDWVISIGRVPGADEPSYFLIQRDSFEIIDDWYTVGMRGTGSKSIRLAPEVFIPAHRCIPVGGLGGGGFTASLIGTPLGVARGALQVYEDGLRARLNSRSQDDVANVTPGLVRLARAAADIESAYLLATTSAGWLEQLDEGESLDPVQAARYRRNQAYAVQQCRGAVNSLFEASGGSNIYESELLQRFWRDMNAAAAHTVHNWENAAVGYGLAALNLPAPRRNPGSRR
jgi:3-hydroxy-9,10-secoandrosta-1,3,5(10)-triene-9,17-dione monooxygenase